MNDGGSDAWRGDEVPPWRDRFLIADPAVVYLDGNSLGRMPLATLARMEELVRVQWGKDLIGGWNAHWLGLSSRIGDKIGRLLGVPAGTTRIADSTSVNLYKLAWGFMKVAGERRTILTDSSNFPSDLYILQGLVQSAGDNWRVLTVDCEGLAPEAIDERIIDAIDERTALVCLSHVHYKSGFAYDLARVTRAAQARGARVLWDLSHSVGAMPIDLGIAQADAAVGCTYKYLNGGPGAPAFLYVRPDLTTVLENPIQGWFGAHHPFDFATEYAPHPSVDRFVVGTPPILSLAAIEPGVDLILEAGIETLRDRSIRMIGYFIERFDCNLASLGYLLATPRDAVHRGSHVSLNHPHAWRIAQALIAEHRIVPDFREPNILRFGITPLYTTRQELDSAVEGLAEVVQSESYLRYPAERRGVT